MMLKFEKQVAVVTGASSGIGKAIAVELATEGATVCIVGRNLETLKVVSESELVDSAKIFSYLVDLAVDSDIQKLVAAIESEHGRVNLLIHSAGIISTGKLETAMIEEFDRQFQLNVRAPYLLTQGFLPFIKSSQGQIVFINSSVVFNSRPGVGQYAATKHALKAIADSLRAEVNANGIRVLSVYAGRTASPMQAEIHAIEGRAYHPTQLMQPEDVALAVLNALSLPSTVEITEIDMRPLKNWNT